VHLVYLLLSFITAFSRLELGIAFIEAQVFVMLTCSYIKEYVDFMCIVLFESGILNHPIMNNL